MPGGCPSLTFHARRKWKEEPAPVHTSICVPEIMGQAALHHVVGCCLPHLPRGYSQGAATGAILSVAVGTYILLLQTIWVQKPQPCSPHTWFQGLSCVKGAGWLMKPSYLCPSRTSRTSPSPSKHHPKYRTGWQGCCRGRGVLVSPQTKSPGQLCQRGPDTGCSGPSSVSQ